MGDVEHLKRQTCTCGNDTYHVNAAGDTVEVVMLVSCAECGRITGSVGAMAYRGNNYDVLTGGDSDA